MKTMMGNSEFKRAIVAMHDHAKITGPMVQNLIEDGLLQARHPNEGGHGSLNRLSMLVNACQHVKTLPTRTIQRYIQAHIDAKFGKLDDGSRGFKFNGKPSATMPDVSWYEWEGNTENKAKNDPDLVRSLKTMITKAKNDIKEGKNVKHVDLLPELEKLLTNATAEVHKEEKAA